MKRIILGLALLCAVRCSAQVAMMKLDDIPGDRLVCVTNWGPYVTSSIAGMQNVITNMASTQYVASVISPLTQSVLGLEAHTNNADIHLTAEQRQWIAEASAHVAVTNGDPHGVLPQANTQIAFALAAYGATGSVYKVQDTASNLLYMAMQNGLQITYRLDITNMYVVFSDDFAYNGVSPGVKTNVYPFTGLNGFNSGTSTNAPCSIFYPDSSPIWYSSGPTLPAVCASHFVEGTGVATVYANYKATPIATNAVQSWVDAEIMTKASPQTYTYYGDITYTNVPGYAAITSTNGPDASFVLLPSSVMAATNVFTFRKSISDGFVVSNSLVSWASTPASSGYLTCTMTLYKDQMPVASNEASVNFPLFPTGAYMTNALSYYGAVSNGFLEIKYTGVKSAVAGALTLYTGPSKSMAVTSYKAPLPYATRDELLAVKSSSYGLTTNDVDARVALGVATRPTYAETTNAAAAVVAAGGYATSTNAALYGVPTLNGTNLCEVCPQWIPLVFGQPTSDAYGNMASINAFTTFLTTSSSNRLALISNPYPYDDAIVRAYVYAPATATPSVTVGTVWQYAVVLGGAWTNQVACPVSYAPPTPITFFVPAGGTNGSAAKCYFMRVWQGSFPNNNINVLNPMARKATETERALWASGTWNPTNSWR